MVAKQVKLYSLSFANSERETIKGLYKLPAGWEWRKLSDILKEDRKTINPLSYPDKKFWLVTMDCVESNTGKLIKNVKRLGKEIKSLKYRFNSSHILYGKLRPYLNKVYCPKMDNEGICTTELIPFKVISAQKEYVSYYLRTSKVVAHAMNNLTGTRQPRVNLETFLNFPIPLPSLEEQKRIVKKLNELVSRIDEIKEIRKKSREETAKILQAALHHVFSKAEEKEWKWVELEKIAEINKENRNPKVETPEREFTYIDISSVESGTGLIIEPKKLLGKDAPSRARRVVHTNDVIMSTVRPYLKSFAIIPNVYNNQICSTGFAVLTCSNNIIPRYLLFSLFSDVVIDQCNSMMMGAHYPALRVNQVKKIRILLPPLKVQKDIVSYLDTVLEKTHILEKRQEETNKIFERVVPSILDMAFKGKLLN